MREPNGRFKNVIPNLYTLIGYIAALPVDQSRRLLGYDGECVCCCFDCLLVDIFVFLFFFFFFSKLSWLDIFPLLCLAFSYFKFFFLYSFYRN